MFGPLLVPLLIFIAVMLGIALALNIRWAGRKTRDGAENVVGFRDPFYRARQMDEYGKEKA